MFIPVVIPLSTNVFLLPLVRWSMSIFLFLLLRRSVKLWTGRTLIGYSPPKDWRVYYGSMTPYSISSHNPASQTTYASLPLTLSGAFMNILPTPTFFHGHGQLPALPPQHPTHSHPNPQGHQQPAPFATKTKNQTVYH